MALDLGGKGSGAALATGQVEALAATVPLALTGVVLMVGTTMYASQILEAGLPEHWTTPNNVERMKKGEPPIGEDGHPVELHHKDQNPNGELVPMTRTEHRGKGNYKKNHPNKGPSKIDRKRHAKQRKEIWTKEADELKE